MESRYLTLGIKRSWFVFVETLALILDKPPSSVPMSLGYLL